MDDIIATDRQIEQILQQITVIPEQVADGIVVIDLAGTIRFFNPAWVAMHGYDATEELIGRHISEFHTEEQMKTLVADFIEETKRRGQLAGPVEYMRKCGTVFCSQTKMTTARDKEGKTIGLVVFAANTIQPAHAQHHLNNQTIELTAANQQLQHQITERQNTENKLKEQRDQLEQRLNQQNTELTAVKEQLQDEITERQQIQQRLKQQADELITALATNEQLQSQISDPAALGSYRYPPLAGREAEKSLKQEIDELTSANEQLKHQITEQAQAKDKLKIHNELLEQHIEQQADEFKAADIKLEQMLTEQKTKAKANAELTAANKKMQNKVTRQKQVEKALKENREQLQQEIARRRQAKEDLTQLRARLNILLANICKLNQELKHTYLKT